MNPFRLAGPVFEFELLTTARRGRYYLMRSAYALILLLVFWQVYESWVETLGATLTPRQAANFSLSVYAGLFLTQLLLVLVLTPALVSGVIASEKQSKTLHYVMASTLSSAEIVLGKLGARMLHVAVFLGVSLPVSSLLVLLGGVDPRLVLTGTLATGASAWFLGAVAILCSVLARRVREALFMAYAVEGAWLILPLVLRPLLVNAWVPFSPGLIAANDFARSTNPLVLLFEELMAAMMGGRGTLAESLIWMSELQFLVGCILVAIAVWRVRPVFKAQGDGPRRPWFVRKPRDAAQTRSRRPAVSDRPILWRERHTARGTCLTRTVGRVVGLALLLPLLYYAVSYGLEAYLEIREVGFWVPTRSYNQAMNRYRFLVFVAWTVPLLVIAGVLQTLAAAAASLTSEHEDDTWISLTATDLTGFEVVGGKWLGAVAGPWKIWLLAASLIAAGIALGAVHPLSLLFTGLLVASYCAFASSLGLCLSTLLRSTGRSQFLAVSLLILANVLGQSLLNLTQYPAPFVMPGLMPTAVGKVIEGPDYLDALRATTPHRVRELWSIDEMHRGAFWATALGALSFVVYGATASLLFTASLWGFERAAGRPRRTRFSREAVDERLAAALDPGIPMTSAAANVKLLRNVERVAPSRDKL